MIIVKSNQINDIEKVTEFMENYGIEFEERNDTNLMVDEMKEDLWLSKRDKFTLEQLEFLLK